MVRYSITGRFIELYFDSIPEEKLREAMKICGWRFVHNKKCWQNFNNNENRVFAESLVQDEIKADDWYEGLDCYYFESDNQIIVRTNSFYCNTHHVLQDIAGEISVIDRNGNIRKYLVPMALCEKCGLYYMLKETYKDLKSKGIIRCQIMTYEQFASEGFYDGDFDKWRDKGPLKLWGYSVDASSNLSEEQRHAVLEDIIDCEAMTKDAVLSYLDFFVRLNSGRGLFVEKWKDDRRYIADYKLGSARRVVFEAK